ESHPRGARNSLGHSRPFSHEKGLRTDIVCFHRFSLRCRTRQFGFKNFPFLSTSRRRTRIFVPEMKQRWTKRAAIDPNQSSASLATDTRSTLYRLLAISRLEQKAPNGNRQDRETRGPCAASRVLPVRFHRPDPPNRPRRSSD